MSENFDFQLSVQTIFRKTEGHKNIHNSQLLKAMRLKFYEHAHNEISNNFVSHIIAQIQP